MFMSKILRIKGLRTLFDPVQRTDGYAIVGFHMMAQKFKLKKLSILPRFYCHAALEELKINCHTNFRFKGFLFCDRVRLNF